MNVLAVTNYAPESVIKFLHKKRKHSLRDIELVGKDGVLPVKPAASFYLFLNAQALRRNLDTINSIRYDDCVGFVFSSPVALYCYEGIALFDYVESEDIHIDGFDLVDPDMRVIQRDSETVVRGTVTFFDAVLEKVSSFTGVLQPFMTFIYSMPKATHQGPVKELGCRWLDSDRSDLELFAGLDNLSKTCPMNDKQKKRFIDILTSEDALLYKTALNHVRGMTDLNSLEFLKIVSDYGLSAYEIRYIKSQVKG